MRKPKCRMLAYAGMDGPVVGRLWLAVTEAGLCAIEFGGEEKAFAARLEQIWGLKPVADEHPLAEAKRQLGAYLAGQRRSFDLPLDLRCLTPFQRQVLAATAEVSAGQLTTYKYLAHCIGRPQAVRAVGRAEATNPLPIVIPCHRVVGSNGALTGYGGGIETKAALLSLEGVMF